MSKKKFVFEFDDESANATGGKNDSITSEYEENETLTVKAIDGAIYLFANRAGMVSLGKTLLKLGLSDYKDGFHLHLHKNFDPDSEEILCIGVSDSN